MVDGVARVQMLRSEIPGQLNLLCLVIHRTRNDKKLRRTGQSPRTDHQLKRRGYTQ
jgi:hypothetical protein